MKRIMKLRHGLFSALPGIIAGFVILWCGFYLLFGASSVFSMRALEIQEAQLAGHLETISARRKDVEDRVVRMRPSSLDWDLVEQEAAAKLGPQGESVKSLNM